MKNLFNYKVITSFHLTRNSSFEPKLIIFILQLNYPDFFFFFFFFFFFLSPESSLPIRCISSIVGFISRDHESQCISLNVSFYPFYLIKCFFLSFFGTVCFVLLFFFPEFNFMDLIVIWKIGSMSCDGYIFKISNLFLLNTVKVSV